MKGLLAAATLMAYPLFAEMVDESSYGKWSVFSTPGFFMSSHLLTRWDSNENAVLWVQCYDAINSEDFDDREPKMGFAMALTLRAVPEGWSEGDPVVVAYRFDNKIRKVEGWRGRIRQDRFFARCENLETIRYFLDNLADSRTLVHMVGGIEERLLHIEKWRASEAIKDFKERCTEFPYSDEMYEAALDRRFVDKLISLLEKHAGY